jgi:hypothetical protein
MYPWQIVFTVILAFPNISDDQLKLINDNVKSRFMLIIFDKKNNKHSGIISLSNINLEKNV